MKIKLFLEISVEVELKFLKMSIQQEFYITLPSNVKTRGEEKNIIGNYKTHFSRRFLFPQNEEWQVGLAEIIYTKSWFNVRNTSKISFITSKCENLQFENVPIRNENGIITPNDDVNLIKPGFFENMEALIEVLNYKLSFCPYGLFHPKVLFDKNKNVVTISCGKLDDEGTVFFPLFGKEIENILGMVDHKDLTLSESLSQQDQFYSFKVIGYEKEYTLYDIEKKKMTKLKDTIKKGFLTCQRKSDIKAGLNSIYIYTDIVEHSFVGDAYAQLLRVIPVKETKNWGEVNHHYFDKPHLIPLQSKNFDTIEVDLKDDTGVTIPFEIGKVTIKLIFKKK